MAHALAVLAGRGHVPYQPRASREPWKVAAWGTDTQAIAPGLVRARQQARRGLLPTCQKRQERGREAVLTLSSGR
jgi:hypothetical protein